MEILLIQNTENVTVTEYVIGALIALLLIGYLLFSLIKPEKF
jgi:K+-transporting ATPase KdpF subunit